MAAVVACHGCCGSMSWLLWEHVMADIVACHGCCGSMSWLLWFSLWWYFYMQLDVSDIICPMYTILIFIARVIKPVSSASSEVGKFMGITGQHYYSIKLIWKVASKMTDLSEQSGPTVNIWGCLKWHSQKEQYFCIKKRLFTLWI